MPENTKGPENDLWAEVTDTVRSAAASAAGAAQAAAAKAQETADEMQARAEEFAAQFQEKADQAQERADEAPDGPAQDAAQKEADRLQEEADLAAERVQEEADRAQEVADELQEAADEVDAAEDEAEAGIDEAGIGEAAARGVQDAETATSTPASGASGASADEQIRSILAMVADGSIDPESAAKLIEEVKAGSASVDSDGTKAQASAAGAKPADPATSTPPVAATKLRVRAVGRRVRIIGEPFVSTVAVDGPHVIRQEGDTLVITSEGEFGASLDGFTLLRTRSLSEVPERVFGFGRELSIRVNPRLLVEAEITAGSINAERLASLEQVRVTAGSAKIRDVEGPFDLLVQAGSAQVEGRISRGQSRLRAESGSVTLHLWPGSNVTIKPDIQLGQVKWEPPGKDRKEHIVGAGEAKLSLEVMMGAATVREAV